LNWIQSSAFVILPLAWLWSTTLQAQVNQSPDSLRFDPVTGLPVEEETEPDTTLQFDPETGLPMEAEPEAPAPPQFDPETGLPIKAQPEAPAPPQFDPVTGKLIPPPAPLKGRLATGEVGLEATPENVIATAEAEAVRYHNVVKHQIAGATGCLFGYIGLPITTLYVESGVSSGFDKNSASLAGAYYRDLSPELQLVYEQAYRNKVKSLRRRSVYGTQIFIFGAVIGMSMLLMMGL